MDHIASASEIIAELNNRRSYNGRGGEAKLDGKLVKFEICIDLGHCRTYIIERQDGDWIVNLFEDKDEDNDEQTSVGNFASATEIVDAIEDEENESDSPERP